MGTCSIDNKECIFGTCEKCPGFDEISNIVEAKIDEEARIQYKQWVHVNRSI